MTVLFADLSGYTSVAERMDPEAVKTLIDRVLLRLGQEVERYGGTVDKYIGDNVMAIFGAPVTHEDDAERAVRAALGMQDAMPETLSRQVKRTVTSPRCQPLPLGTGSSVCEMVGELPSMRSSTVLWASALPAWSTLQYSSVWTPSPAIATEVIAVELGKLTTGDYASTKQGADAIAAKVNAAAH